MSTDRYSLHPQVDIHNASDQSGILLYNGFSGSTIRLSTEFGDLIRALKEQGALEQGQIFDFLNHVDDRQAEEVWLTLVSNFILVPEQSLET